MRYSPCVNQKRTMSLFWADSDCDPKHKDSILELLPEPTEINCKGCGIGQSRDKEGNCKFCPTGFMQPLDFRPNSELSAHTDVTANSINWLLSTHSQQEQMTKDVAPVTCKACPAGTFAEKTLELSDFESVPPEFYLVTCTAITGSVGKSDCGSRHH